jgi:hypothetical protein
MSKSIVLAIAFIGLAALACSVTLPIPSVNTITGSGNVVSTTEDYSGFTRLEISSAFKATVQQGDSFSVVIRTDDNLVPYLRITQSGDTLQIGLETGINFLSNPTLEADITMPALSGIQANGASRATVSGFSSSDSLQVEASGASSVSGDIQAGDTSVSVSGASKVSLSGSGGNLNVEASGASTVDLEGFTGSDVKVVVSGASKATVNPSGTLDVEASGASHVTYLGNPTMGSVNTSGASTVSHK